MYWCVPWVCWVEKNIENCSYSSSCSFVGVRVGLRTISIPVLFLERVTVQFLHHPQKYVVTFGILSFPSSLAHVLQYI